MLRLIAREFAAEEKIHSPGRPVPFLPRLESLAIAALAVGLGTAMWIWDELYFSDLVPMILGEPPQQQFKLAADFVWCRPTGTLLLALGVLVLWRAFPKPAAEADEP